MKTNLTNFAVFWAKRRQKAGFLSPRGSKITVTKEKERRKRKSEEIRKGGEEKKTMVAHLVFQMAALDGKGPFGGSVFKNPARITKAPCRAGLPRIKNPPGVKERRVKKVG